MITQKVELKNPERFSDEYIIPRSKLEKAIEKALDKTEINLAKFGEKFVGNASVNLKYTPGENDNWVSGMHTGLYLLAYELSGNKKFRDVAEAQIHTYRERLDKRYHLGTHDVGFTYTPSCVAYYKIFGDEKARQTALDAAEYFYNYSYSEKGGFIIRVAAMKDEVGCRTMMDTLMNAPLLFWAGKETGDERYTKAAISQNKITEKYLIRDDASSFHHYQFDPETHMPVKGLTFQGYADDSTWARGHSWGISGFPITYSYTGDEKLFDLHRDITYYLLNNLPDDLIPYWDLDFTNGDDQPRDSSTAAISVCGMNQMCKYLPDSAPQKTIYKNASAAMLDALIDKCSVNPEDEAEGLIAHVAGAVPQNIGIDECAMYADYFYLEALTRFYKPDWQMHW